MDLRRELQIIVLTLALFNLTLAFGAIGLFVRMGPAIERILEENIVSIVAAEEMLSAFANSGGKPLPIEAEAKVEKALASAEGNLTEEAERALLERMRRDGAAAVREDGLVRSRFIDDAARLITINRDAMQRVGRQAQRLGRAGAWAAVLIGLLAFGTSLLVLARLQRRFVRPLVELHRVLEDARTGEKFRRCGSFVDAPRELLDVTQAINALLDERLGAKRPS